MLLHLSFAARDTDRVARVVAELLGATVVDCPSPPFRAGSKFVCAFDEAGTMVEIVPSGTVYVPGPGNRTDMVDGPHLERTPVHGNFTTPLTVTEALAIAEREGWPSGLIDNGPFQVVNVWLEGTQLIELFPAELVGGYLALYGPEGRDVLDRGLRALEASLRDAVGS